MKSRRHGAPWARMLMGLVLLVGCTGHPEPTPSTATPLPASADSAINAQARERVRDGGLLRLSVDTLPTQWNPRHADASLDDLVGAGTPLTPTHMTIDAAGRATANPDFITAADVNNTDITTVTLTLHPQAQWGDTTPITAADWIATWKASTGQIAGITPTTTSGWDRVTDVRAGDTDHTVILTYTGIDPDWAEPLVDGPLKAADTASTAAFSWTEADNAHYAAPFSIAHVDDVQGLVTLERNPLWWGDTPKLERIMIRAVAAEALATAFQYNELDVWEPTATTDDLQKARASADTSVRSAAATSGRALTLSLTGTLADEDVRRGVLLALDRASIGAADTLTSVADVRVWSNTLMLPTQPGYVDEARSTGLDHDTTQAATLLDEAGWTLVDGIRQRGGVPLTLTLASTLDEDASQADRDTITDQLAAIGITVTATDASADLTLTSITVDGFPLAHLPAAATETPEAHSLVNKVTHEVDPVRRADQASQLARLLWQQVTWIPLYQETQYVAVRDGLANLGAQGYGTTAWEDVGWTA